MPVNTQNLAHVIVTVKPGELPGGGGQGWDTVFLGSERY